VSVLADTPIWIKHFMQSNADLRRLVIAQGVYIHSSIIGELIVGNLPNRSKTIPDLYTLPRVAEIPADAVLLFIEQHTLFGKGLSWVDAQLLAASVTENIPLWTVDVRLQSAAQQFNLAFTP
jgi:predicted nucleic acid-binding protein